MRLVKGAYNGGRHMGAVTIIVVRVVDEIHVLDDLTPTSVDSGLLAARGLPPFSVHLSAFVAVELRDTILNEVTVSLVKTGVATASDLPLAADARVPENAVARRRAAALKNASGGQVVQHVACLEGNVAYFVTRGEKRHYAQRAGLRSLALLRIATVDAFLHVLDEGFPVVKDNLAMAVRMQDGAQHRRRRISAHVVDFGRAVRQSLAPGFALEVMVIARTLRGRPEELLVERARMVACGKLGLEVEHPFIQERLAVADVRVHPGAHVKSHRARTVGNFMRSVHRHGTRTARQTEGRGSRLNLHELGGIERLAGLRVHVEAGHFLAVEDGLHPVVAEMRLHFVATADATLAGVIVAHKEGALPVPTIHLRSLLLGHSPGAVNVLLLPVKGAAPFEIEGLLGERIVVVLRREASPMLARFQLLMRLREQDPLDALLGHTSPRGQLLGERSESGFRQRRQRDRETDSEPRHCPYRRPRALPKRKKKKKTQMSRRRVSRWKRRCVKLAQSLAAASLCSVGADAARHRQPSEPRAPPPP
mmetsp:Transcript_41787/g.130873  ORF Transcript_41787/g.130873 Transcript_41787/m.130873 type:complete len:535 (+) Transcript_41787:1321-2925(+)